MWIRWLTSCAVVVLFTLLSCGGSGKGKANETPAEAETTESICKCAPSVPDSEDYRHIAKHVSPSAASRQDITVADIMQWAAGADPPPTADRTGRELQMFHIPTAYVQFVWLVPNVCDIHMEISDTPDPSAPRMIVETPRDPEYCSTRKNEVTGLARHSVPISTGGFNLAQPVQVEVLGLAFQDSNHERGTRMVSTVWELHPAIVAIK
jgi:hypothetical protein